MSKFITLFLSCCAMLVLSGCPRPGGPARPPGPPADLACGSRTLPACPADQYCKYDSGANCGRADAPGVCRPRPEFCTQEYAPVCGCNGKTYSNACMAAHNGISVDYTGECSR